MECHRLKHYARLNSGGTIGRCGHMVKTQSFKSFDEMESSEWLKNIKEKMVNNIWPEECYRCQQTEKLNGTSIRLNALDRHRILYAQNKEYLIVGGVLDNICNNACISCNANLSTKIGSLYGKNYPRLNNVKVLKTFPQERIYEIDINGGEPSASKNYKKLLMTLPKNTKIVRINTNGSRFIKEIQTVLDQSIRVIVTLSLDGINKIHDYTRWPIKWDNYKKIVEQYLNLRSKNKFLKLDFWTTVSCLNINDMPNIFNYTKTVNIQHQYGILNSPDPMNIIYKNPFTNKAKKEFQNSNEKIANDLLPTIAIDKDNTNDLTTFLDRQDELRKINRYDYYKT